MFSYLTLVCALLISFAPYKNRLIHSENYAVLISCLSFSSACLGFIGLILTFLNSTNIPIIIISLFILVGVLLSSKDPKQEIVYIFITLYEDLKKIRYGSKNKKGNRLFFAIFVIIIGVIYLASIGPINHPDAADYHVGYPFQYYLRGGIFVDGGLCQGLLGVADYQNIAFIQENTVWLIRSVQAFAIAPLILFLIRLDSNKLMILAFMTTPVMMQWVTIGKPLFLGEAAIAISYLLWKDSKSDYLLRLLVISIICAISFKISSIIISLPIIIDIFLYLLNKNLLAFTVNKLIKDQRIVISFLILFGILASRQYITGNFAYPLFTNYFNNDNLQIIDFAHYLKGYQRDGFFPINIFIPFRYGLILSGLGPGLLLIVFASVYNLLLSNYSSVQEKNIYFISLSQFFLLIFFCQGRGDYYLVPFILFVANSRNKDLIFFSSSKRIFLLITKILIIVQFNIIIISSLFSIYQTGIIAFDYNNMIHIAYGFNESLLIDDSIEGNFINLAGRNTRLFYTSKYIDSDLYYKCLYDKNRFEPLSIDQECIDEFKVNQLLIPPNISKDIDNFNCTLMPIYRASRIPLNRKKYNIGLCLRK